MEYSNNNFKLPIDNKILKELFISYLKNAKGAGRTRVGNLKELYYEITINNIHFPGQRPFYTRMNDIVNNINGKERILDIGSNIGLIGLFLIYYHDVKHVTFIEHDKECCGIINKLAKLLKVQDKIKIVNKNFNNINFEKEIGNDYDLVIMLSSFKYFDNREKAMNYFDNFKSILFEGDDKKYETYFEKLFIDKNFNVKKINRINDERNRMLYLMSK
tara:strand:- start:19 stop:669 length:651 start_codon:yes stop_codon:yes gene_type:complete